MRARAFVVGIALTAFVACPGLAQHFPETIDRSCRNGRAKIYDECGSQMVLLQKAIQRAEAEGKIVLVEWCVWCHSFNQTIKGMRGPTVVFHEGDAVDMGELDRSRPDLAESLQTFVEETFVVVSIEAQYSPDGASVLAAVGSPEPFGLPFVFSLKDGRIAAIMKLEEELPGLELRSNYAPFYRGYDRAVLLDELTRLAEAAR
jgi:hypothetical protein